MRRTWRKSKNKNKILVISATCLLLCICVGYAAFETNISITAKGNVVQNTRVIQSWDYTSQTDFHSDFYKENIVSVTFLDNNNIPSNATESWNVSENQESGLVKAWVIPNSSDSTKYDLYIGAPYGVIANEDSSYIFYYFEAVTSINFNNNYDTSNATTMRSMFMHCTSLTELDLSSFDTSNVTIMRNMFNMYDDSNSTPVENKLANIIFGDGFDMSNVVDIHQMFIGCYNLTELDIENWDTRNVTNMSSAFAHCYGLKYLDLSNWDTSQVTSMAWMFRNCENLISLNLSGFDTSNVTTMYQMFMHCTSLTELNLCSFDTGNVTDMKYMISYTTNLTRVLVGSNWSTTQADVSKMFENSGVSAVTTGQC